MYYHRERNLISVHGVGAKDDFVKVLEKKSISLILKNERGFERRKKERRTKQSKASFSWALKILDNLKKQVVDHNFH
jgi:hypothetical protein